MYSQMASSDRARMHGYMGLSLQGNTHLIKPYNEGVRQRREEQKQKEETIYKDSEGYYHKKHIQ